MELGSEFSFSFSDLSIRKNNVLEFFSVFPETYYFDCGRGALQYIARFLKSQDKVLLPECICDSVINCFNKKSIVFYQIDEKCQIVLDDLLKKLANDVKILYIVHYFGTSQARSVLKELKEACPREVVIVEDITQNLFSQNEHIGDYIISSVRKWLPLPGCGSLSVINNKLNIPIPIFPKSTNNKRAVGMVLKDLFIKKELDCHEEYRKIFINEEKLFYKRYDIYMISDFSRFLLRCFEVNEIIEKRKRNYNFLKEKLSKIGLNPINDIVDTDCPFAFVIRVNNRDEFRQYLIQNSIYCAVHWPFDGFAPKEREMSIHNSETLISLPIDQRYDFEHLDYMISIISQYRGDLSF